MMKKIFALLLVCLMCLALASCGNQSDTATPDAASPDEAAATEAATAAASASSAASSSDATKPAVYETIEEYLEDPEVKESLSGVNESVENVISFSYHADGNILYYNYTYLKVYDEKDLEVMKKSHDDLLEENAGNNRNVVSVLRTHTKVENPQLVVTYYNGDGTVITSRTYE